MTIGNQGNNIKKISKSCLKVLNNNNKIEFLFFLKSPLSKKMANTTNQIIAYLKNNTTDGLKLCSIIQILIVYL
jgi:hypothetical protein